MLHVAAHAGDVAVEVGGETVVAGLVIHFVVTIKSMPVAVET